MEERGAAYTVNRMDAMKLQINRLETQIEQNEASIKRVIDIMTRELGKPRPNENLHFLRPRILREGRQRHHR